MTDVTSGLRPDEARHIGSLAFGSLTPPKLPGPPWGHFLPSIRFILVPQVGHVP